METMKVRLHFVESVLGSLPGSDNIYRDYIASKAPDAATVEDEIAAIGVEGKVEKGKTVFAKKADGTPFLYDYHIKGFFKGACGFLRNADDSLSAEIKAYKKKIDGLIFVTPRQIEFRDYGAIDECQRPLRAATPMGERVSIAISEEIPEGAWIEFDVHMLAKKDRQYVEEWLDFGRWNGLSQWRNSGKGRFLWEELDANGKRIGGNYTE